MCGWMKVGGLVEIGHMEIVGNNGKHGKYGKYRKYRKYRNYRKYGKYRGYEVPSTS